MTEPAKRKTRGPIVTPTAEPFDSFVKRLLAVPKKEIDRKQAAYERKKAMRQRAV